MPRCKKDEDDERVFVLGTGVNRFTPQWDEQVLGPENVFQSKKDYPEYLESITPDQLTLYYCGECQLTWLKGQSGVGPVQSHPCHDSLNLRSRTVMVFTRGACPNNGTSSAVESSIGVYFGPESKYNIAKRLANDHSRIAAIQAAEIAAAAEALRQVRETVEPARRAVVQGPSFDLSANQKRFRLVVATDSSYVVECMCKHIEGWTMDDGTYKNECGEAIVNGRGFAELTHEVEELSMVGVQVSWYRVPRIFNQEAVGLARLALRS